MLIEKCVEFQLPRLAIFVDFKAAFDSIHHPPIWNILADYGIPVKYIQLIRCVCQKTARLLSLLRAREQTGSGLRLEFARDVCGLHCFLGVIIDFVLRKSCHKPSAGICLRERRRIRLGIEQSWHLTDLDYADDVALLDSGSDRGHQALRSLQRTGEEVGVTISKSKTKAMGFGETEAAVHLDGEAVDTVNHFGYLGYFQYLG